MELHAEYLYDAKICTYPQRLVFIWNHNQLPKFSIISINM